MHSEQSRLKRSILGLAIGAIAALTLACGGGGGDDPDPTATSGSGGSSGGTTGTATPSGSGSGSGSNAPTRASISNLNSYKYTIKMTGTGSIMADIAGGLEEIGGSSSGSVTFEVSGAYIKPDKAQTTIKLGSFETSTVIIGNQQWTSAFGQVIGPSPATTSDVTSANFLADFWTDDGLGSAIEDFKCGGKENVNGVSATKCTLDKAAVERLSREDPTFMDGINASSLTTANVDAWIADGGYPVRMRMQMAGKDDAGANFTMNVEMDVTDINGNFQITAPRT